MHYIDLHRAIDMSYTVELMTLYTRNKADIILGMGSANETWCYKVTFSHWLSPYLEWPLYYSMEKGNNATFEIEWQSQYRQVSNIRPTLVANWIVDHSDVVGASPVGTAPTTSSFST